MYKLKYEISRTPPDGSPMRIFETGNPILYAFGCVLLEYETEKKFIYTAVNLETGKRKILSNRMTPLSPSEVEKMVERILKSNVAGAGRYHADRAPRQQITFNKAKEILKHTFKNVLPQHGYSIRKEQIDLASHILSAIHGREVTLAEAKVGTGKTLAYLIPAIIVKRGRLNDFGNLGLYPNMPYANMRHMPIVIATSSIALQRALLTDYIPELSEILMEASIITTPLTAILRKGKEHYICEHNLRARILYEANADLRQTLEALLLPSAPFDIAEIDGLTPNIKRKISVSGRCVHNCPHYDTCKYLKFKEQTQYPAIDIQICNHNYLLADTLHRAKERRTLIPNYQSLIIDEAHKFLQAARTMYGSKLTNTSAVQILEKIDRMVFKREGHQFLARRMAKKLFDENSKLFSVLAAIAHNNQTDNHSDRFTITMEGDAVRHLRNIRKIAEHLNMILRDEAFFVKASDFLVWIHDKYHADISSINIKGILLECSEDVFERDEQDEIMDKQINTLYREICKLPEIVNKAESERLYNLRLVPVRQRDTTLYASLWQKVKRLLPVEKSYGKSSEWVIKLIWDIEKLHEQAVLLKNHNDLICWIETIKDETSLCAVPKELGKRLFDDQWRNGIPTILTSGTLSSNGDFSRIKKTLGLDLLKNRLTETSKPSPFNYAKNMLLYISENMPFPDQNSSAYISAVVDEVEKLVMASYGHAAVLFTSYRMMDMVWTKIRQRTETFGAGIPFPMFRLDKGGIMEIERFKNSGNGVLFASGAMWEGIDIPGDALSMLIIVKLPFPVPDPISEYERMLYGSMSEFKECVIKPEMGIKALQGSGRLIRKEKDTGVVAFIDIRVAEGEAYRDYLLSIMPPCRVTKYIADVEEFIASVKSDVYFL